MRVIELFAGVGGVAAALEGSGTDLTAVDINADAQTIYRANFEHGYAIREIDSVSDSEFANWSADLWWMSPPCQPYSRRGNRKDMQDRRSFAIQRILQALTACAPSMIALENVYGFELSQAHEELTRWLHGQGYWTRSCHLCPSDWGWPNRRPRFFLIASREPGLEWQTVPQFDLPLSSFVDSLEPSIETKHLWLSTDEVAKYGPALDRVNLCEPRPTACFAGSYGKTWLHAGSYLETEHGLRRFHPREVARLLGFEDGFRLPKLAPLAPQSDRKLWKLLGNSLSIPSVRYVLSHLPL